MNNNNPGRRKKTKIRWDRVMIVGGGFLLIIVVVFSLNFNRFRCLFKGYSFKETSQILDLKKTEQKELLTHDKLNNITLWMSGSRKVSSYDEYERYLTLFPDLEAENIILTVDSILEKTDSLEKLGYNEEVLWKILIKASVSDLDSLINNKYLAEELMKYYAVAGFKFSNYDGYRIAYATYGDYAYSVNSVNYPFIISSSDSNGSYLIKNPEQILTLVKKGFYLAEDYVPSDLVIPDVNIIEERADSAYVRKVMVDDLKEMFKAAETLGYKLYISSAYGSYEEQQTTYNEIEYRYGGAYAKEYVALPGASEHQLGLGIDLTSQNVIDGINNVFSDTIDYDWVVENCYKYGFIIRYEDEQSAITGIAHEPWHIRYVGKEVAKIIYEEGITFEQYCLKYSVIPELTTR